jgi:phosphotransferase system enzyme I (PtsP)
MASKRVYEKSAASARLEAVLDLVAFAARPMALATLLDEVPKRIARIVGADVCSVYVLEGEGELVMRGNVGFPPGALGHVRLSIGEGITGEAVEYMRPIAAELARQHGAYRHFDELGEDRFPVFLAAPIRGKSGPLGALVVQRRAHPFTDHDVELLVLVGALIAAGIRTAELLDAQKEVRERRRAAGGGTRKVTLGGTPVVPGRALGAVAALRRPNERASQRVDLGGGSGDRDVARLKGAFDTAEKALAGLGDRARQLRLGRRAAFLETYQQILSDGRLRELALELAPKIGIAAALARVAREATRTAAREPDPFLEERARDVEDLCDALVMLAESDRRAELPQRALLVGDRITVFDVLVSARARPVGIALSERAAGPRTQALLELLGVPAVCDVRGLFRWASDADIALLDADHGLFVLNPSKSEIAAVRRHRAATS